MVAAIVDEKETTVVISSMLVETTPGRTAQVSRQIGGIQGVQTHGAHGSNIIVSVEAESVDASFAIASNLTSTVGVTGVQLVYANFEDDPVIQRKLQG